MTMNYCGKCGSANGARALFCRQCGTELSNQTTLSSPSAPLNVEFMAKPPSKELPNLPVETRKAVEEKSSHDKDVSDEKGQPNPDPITISQSLRKVRASGPLIIEASMKKEQQMNQIIEQSIEGPDIDQIIRKTPEMPAPSLIEAGQRQKPNAPSRALRSGHETRPSAASATRTGSGRNRGETAIGMGGHLPPNGPSSVLAQASGLKPSGIGSKLRIGLISMAVIIAMVTYFVFRDRILTPDMGMDGERNLMRVEDQSSQYLRLGESDLEHGNFNQAIEYFQRALSLTPNNPNVHYMLAQAHMNAGQTDEAMKVYQALLRLAPERLEARLQVAEIYRAKGNWSAAYAEYQRIIALDQNSVQAALALEAIEAQQADTLAVAGNAGRRRSSKTRNISPVLPPGVDAGSQFALLQQRTLQAPSFSPPPALTEGNPNDNPDPRDVAETRKKLGLRYLNVREFRASINEFLAALRLTPEDKDLYYFLGSAYYGLGQHAQAHDYYKRVDGGQYLPVAQSGAQRTEKAAREEYKRRMEMLRNQSKNEIGQENDSDSTLGKNILNSLN